MFTWTHFERVETLLDQEPDDDAYNDVFDVLEAVLADPFDRVLTMDHRGTSRQPGSRIALLPHGYVLSFRVYERGIPPWAVPTLSVVWFGRLD